MNLVEVLVSLVIFCCILLGLAGFQVKALKFNRDSLYQTLAMTQIASISDVLRADIRGRLPPQVKTEAIQAWQSRLSDLLPQGHGCIEANDHSYRIEITWLSNQLKFDLVIDEAQ